MDESVKALALDLDLCRKGRPSFEPEACSLYLRGTEQVY